MFGKSSPSSTLSVFIGITSTKLCVNSFGVGSWGFFSGFEDGDCFGFWWVFWYLTITLESLELHSREKFLLVKLHLCLLIVTWFGFLLYVSKIKRCSISIFTAAYLCLNKVKHQLFEARIVFLSVCISLAQLGVTGNAYMEPYCNKCHFQPCIVKTDCANREFIM